MFFTLRLVLAAFGCRVAFAVCPGNLTGQPTCNSLLSAVGVPIDEVQLASKRAVAKAAALKRLPQFKKDVLASFEGAANSGDGNLMKYFGHRADAFYLRFLEFDELYEGTDKPAPLTLIINYCKFINKWREKGHLDGLGAEMLRPLMKKHLLEMLTTRDNVGRHVLLTFAHNVDEKIPDPVAREKLYLYWFMKLMTYDDTMDKGLLIMHDFQDVTLFSLTKHLAGLSQDTKSMFVDSTFPWTISKMLFVNTKLWMRANYGLIKPFIAQSIRDNVEFLGGVWPPGQHGGFFDKDSTQRVLSFISRDALPTGAPYYGNHVQAEDAGFNPGLGAFFEPGMDPAEQQQEVQQASVLSAASQLQLRGGERSEHGGEFLFGISIIAFVGLASIGLAGIGLKVYHKRTRTLHAHEVPDHDQHEPIAEYHQQ